MPNNDIDEDCDGEVLIIDEDGDGFNSDEDCDDLDPGINPGAEEIANNGIDEDCDGEDLISFTSDHSSLDVDIYPNPTSQALFVENPKHTLHYRLYNQLGELVVSGQLINGLNRIHIQNLANGGYWFVINDPVSNHTSSTLIVKK